MIEANLSMLEKNFPLFSDDVNHDCRVLTSFCNMAEEILSMLPVKSERSSSELNKSDSIHHICRKARKNFLKLHVSWLFDKIVEGLPEKRVNLSEIALAAADLVPGLAPSHEQLAEESNRMQADKEGRELDQGILFHSILNQSETGNELIEYLLRVTPRALSLIESFRSQNELDLGKIRLTKKGQAAYVEFKNSDCLNAEDNELIADFETAVDLILMNPEINVGVLRGSIVEHHKYKGRRIFSAGINLKHIHQGKISFSNFILGRELGYINKMMRGATLGNKEEKLCKPWLAAVETFAIGGGMQLLFACDYVLGTDDSYVCLPAAKEGIVPGVSNLRLAHISHGRLAQQVILHGKKIRATDEVGKYVFDRVVAPEEMDNAIEEGIRVLNSPAVVANRKMLFMAREPLESFRSYMAEFSIEQAKRLYAEDVNQKVSKI